MNRIKYIMYFLIIIPLSCYLFILGKPICFDSQEKLLEFLVSASSVVFAVMGIWLAVVFPEVISGIYKEQTSEKKQELLIKAKKLLTPLIIAACITVSVIIFRFLILINDTYLLIDTFTLQGLVFVYLFYAIIFLVAAIALSISPGLQMLFDAARELRKQKRKDRFTGK